MLEGCTLNVWIGNFENVSNETCDPPRIIRCFGISPTYILMLNCNVNSNYENPVYASYKLYNIGISKFIFLYLRD